MAVTHNATSSAPSSASATTTHDHSGLTIAAGSNRALVVQLAYNVQVGSISGLSVTWDQGGTNQACTLINSQNVAGGGQGHVQHWGLVAPTTGNRTLRVSWTGSADIIVNAVAFDGVDQTGSTTTFAHATTASNSTPTASPSIVITSAVGNMTLETMVDDSADPSSPTQTQTFLDTLHAVPCGGSRGTGAATVTHAWTLGGTSNWAQVGVDIVAAPSSVSIPIPAGTLNMSGLVQTVAEINPSINDAKIVIRKS